jgi:hypothetical protein
MQGVRYEYKLIIAYMFDTAIYKLCKYINLEYNSIKGIRELQKRGRDKPIPNTPRQPREPEESYFSLNSTNLWTKQERNLRESNLRCATRVSWSAIEGSHLEPLLGANVEAPPLSLGRVAARWTLMTPECDLALS